MGGKGNGGMGGGGDLRQMPGPWRMPTSWGMSPSSGLSGSFPAGGQFAGGGGFGRMGGYPGAAPWAGGQPWGSSMQAQGQGMGQMAQGALPGTAASSLPPQMSHGDPLQPMPQMSTGDPAGQMGGGVNTGVVPPPQLGAPMGLPPMPQMSGGDAPPPWGARPRMGTGASWQPSAMVPQMSTNDPAPGTPGGYATTGMGMSGGGQGLGYATPWATLGGPRRFF